MAVAIVALSGFVASTAPAVARSGSTAQALRHRPALDPLGRAKPATWAPNAAAPSGDSPWRELHHLPSFHPGTMLLASDGTVLVHSEPESGGTPDWYRLTPDSSGSYINGTWTQIPSMPNGYNPLYFSSAILPDGRMIVEGGEYLGGNPVWTNRGALYDPVTNKWRVIAPPAGWANIGDAQGMVLANGTFLLSQACQNCTAANGSLSTALALFNATGLNWLTLSERSKNDPNDEEGWALQPNGQLLTVDTWLTPTTELFTPSHLAWSFAGNTPRSPVNQPAAEVGPEVLLPNGDTFVVSAGSGPEAPAPCTTKSPAPNALYSGGRWVPAPVIPTFNGMQFDSADGPAAVLPDGNVLFDASPCVFNAPLAMLEYDAATRTVHSVPTVPNAANDSTFFTRMLNLPNGQVLFNDGSHHMLVFTGGGTPDPSWAPVITGLSTGNLHVGQAATVAGQQLAGRDQGSAYGDDVQSYTNFPLVRIKNIATGVTTYARTHDWTSVSVAPGAQSSTRFTLPAGTPSGPSLLTVVANGIASAPVQVSVS